MAGPADGRFIDVDGVRVHYRDQGAGPALLMLQAFGPLPGTTAWFTFERVLPGLAESFRCILIDNPNFGLSSPALFNEPIHDMYVRQALAVLDHEGVECASVLGTSTGGTVALDLALAAPGRVERMVVGSCEFSTGGEPGLLAPFPSEVARLFDEYVRCAPDRERLRRLLRALVYDSDLITEELIDQLHSWRRAEPEHTRAWLASTSVPASHGHELRQVMAPTLIVHGQQDRMVPLEQALRLLTLLPNANLTVLGRCGHWPTVERPRDYAASALAFLTAT